MGTNLDVKGILVGSGHKFRKEVLLMPVIALSETTQHMKMRYGIQGKETVGQARSGAKLRPYRTSKDATNTASIEPRTLETFLGDVVEEFDPYTLYGTIYSEPTAKKRTDLEIVKTLSVEMARQATEDLPKAIFTGVRNAAGDDTMDLFDGFDTICIAEKVLGNISALKGNYIDITNINAANVGDKLKAIHKAAHTVLKNSATKMFIPVAIKELYDEWFLANFGAVSYNTTFEQTFLHGTNKKCELVALPGMIDSTHIFLTTKNNMLVGCDQESDKERVEINKADNPKVVQFFMTAFYGVQFESIDPKVFMAAQFSLDGDPSLAVTPDAIACNETVVNATSTKTMNLKGENLTGAIDLAVSGAGFTLSASTVSVNDAEASTGKNITVTFAPTEAKAYTAKIIIAGGGISRVINVTGTGKAAE